MEKIFLFWTAFINYFILVHQLNFFLCIFAGEKGSGKSGAGDNGAAMDMEEEEDNHMGDGDEEGLEQDEEEGQEEEEDIQEDWAYLALLLLYLTI